ncbi:hypothetical protein [Novosphingobium terrae]|uniref:hypothetical protein n=1 Tax=Novosphingobium terrae TaxID=2726189 RepID=UPI00197CF58B|nr:hypothetical protein [Novosphingobium terrae]
MPKLPSFSKLPLSVLPTAAAALTGNPIATRAADQLRKGHRRIAGEAIEAVLLETQIGKKGGLSLPRKLVGAALTRIATRSVPGAIVVGGALLAKHLYDKKKEHEAEAAAKMREAEFDNALLSPLPVKKAD